MDLSSLIRFASLVLRILAGKTPTKKSQDCRPNDNLTSNEALLFTPVQQSFRLGSGCYQSAGRRPKPSPQFH
jgi:hypothetical protein